MFADEVQEVLAANARFYQAFESLGLSQMEQVWAQREYVGCVHPGWPRVQGWPAVRDSWEAIFRNTREMRFTLTEVRVEVRGDLAWVACTENIVTESPNGLMATATQATNVYERHGGWWLMVHHHASPVLAAPSDAA